MRNWLTCLTLTSLVGATMSPVPAAAQTPQPAASGAGTTTWKPEDTQRFQHVSEVRISPDGRLVALEVTRTDYPANRHHSVVAVTSADGSRPLQILTAPGANESSPRWSPDGRRLAVLTDTKGEASALWTMDPDGSHRQHVTDVVSTNQRFADEEEGDPYAWSPDGKWFAFAGVDPANQARGREPLVITRYMYQAYTDYDDGRRTQIWVVGAGGGQPRLLSDGHAVDLAPAWSPDGSQIVFVSNREPDPDFHRNDDLFVVDVATGRVRQLTSTVGSEVHPVWSPDGKWIAYLATKRKWATYDSMAEDFHIWVTPADGGQGREVNATLDRRSLTVAWAPDSRSVIFTAEDRGRVLPYRVSVEGGESTSLFSADVAVIDPSIARDGRLAFGLTSTTRPTEAAVLDVGAASPRVITQVNAPALATLATRDAEMLWFRSTENTPVQGWLLTPDGASPTHKVPLVLFIHGGPHGAFGYTFSPEHQMYAARGYAVLYINPRGSSAYGQQFSDACIGNWGGVDYEDLMMGLDQVLTTHQQLDPDRMFVTGTSYGGFMTNWVVTHTGRFRAAVTREGMSNLMTDQSLSDAWDLEVIEFGPPATNADNYLRWSPIRYIANAVTPTMIIHGDRDHDVTMAEAGQMYSGLRLQGVESQLVIYPREPHGFHEPHHIVDAYDRMWRWFEAHRSSDQHMDQHWDSDRGVKQWDGEVPGRTPPKS